MSDRETQLKFLQAAQEMERRQRKAPMFYYKPHYGQKRFHDSFRYNRISICTAGNRFGKTYASGAEVIARLYGYRIWEVPGLKLTDDGDYPPRSSIDPVYWYYRPDGLPQQLPAVGLVCSGLPALQGILGAIWPVIQAFLPPAVQDHPDYSLKRGAYGVPVSLELPHHLSTGGGKLQFGSGDQSPMAYEGRKFTFAAIDEPPKKPIFNALWRGLTDHYGDVWFTMTPIGPNAPWVYDEFIASGREDVTCIHGSGSENIHISKEAHTEFIEGGGFTDEEKQARAHGSWSFLSHRAFPNFDPAVHVVPPYQIPSGWQKGLAIDPAHRRPFALLWCAFGPDNEVVVYREWPHVEHHKLRSSEYSVADYAQLIREMECGEHIDFRCLDPRFGSAKPTLKGERYTSIQEDFWEHNINFDCRMEGTEREEIGLERIRGLLRYDKTRPLCPLNKPKLRIFDNCINTINSLALSNFKPPSLMDPDKLDEKLAEKYKDFRDSLRYAILYPRMNIQATENEGYLSEDDLAKWNDQDDDWF